MSLLIGRCVPGCIPCELYTGDTPNTSERHAKIMQCKKWGSGESDRLREIRAG